MWLLFINYYQKAQYWTILLLIIIICFITLIILQVLLWVTTNVYCNIIICFAIIVVDMILGEDYYSLRSCVHLGRSQWLKHTLKASFYEVAEIVWCMHFTKLGFLIELNNMHHAGLDLDLVWHPSLLLLVYLIMRVNLSHKWLQILHCS